MPEAAFLEKYIIFQRERERERGEFARDGGWENLGLIRNLADDGKRCDTQWRAAGRLLGNKSLIEGEESEKGEGREGRGEDQNPAPRTFPALTPSLGAHPALGAPPSLGAHPSLQAARENKLK